ncbi:Unknown protein [Striga hermonthica]|uniref:BED-type domain-containing protein n=1 Tax=Striga hermonthica TaxID=68872 RepID=A0A9N7NL67_STRHE|nr:Unknown protein [Striga hermonthica]
MSPQDVCSRGIGSIDDSGGIGTPHPPPVNMNEEPPSLGDEEFGSDDEEVEVGTNEVATPDDGLESLDPFRQKKRARKSKAWDDFKDVVVGMEKTLMSECIHCQKIFLKTKTSTTTSLLRHMNVCHKRLVKLKKPKQQKINFPAAGDSSARPYLHTGKFDMAGMREAAAEWVLMHEHPFSIMEEDGFNLMLKRGMPEWNKISRTSSKNDCKGRPWPRAAWATAQGPNRRRGTKEPI